MFIALREGPNSWCIHARCHTTDGPPQPVPRTKRDSPPEQARQPPVPCMAAALGPGGTIYGT